MPTEELSVTSESWRMYADDPLPGWGSRSFTLFDVPSVRFGDNYPGADCAVFSLPFDSTASTRVGARYGPRAIREGSLAYASQQKSRGVSQLLNMRTGALVTIRDTRLVDFGDLHIYPSDPRKQMQSVAAESFHIAQLYNRVVMLGGEHSLTYGCYCGVAQSVYAKTGKRTGYLQIDHHFDFGNQSVLHGPYYHGSNARRISEHPLMSPPAMGFVGQGDFTSATQYQNLIESGVTVRNMVDVRHYGFETCLREALDRLTQHVDNLYVSIDIDVCDTATAPGTGHVTVGGISAAEFLSIASILQKYPVVGLDIVEVSPPLDASGSTAHLAARLLYEYLFLEEAGGCKTGLNN